MHNCIKKYKCSRCGKMTEHLIKVYNEDLKCYEMICNLCYSEDNYEHSKLNYEDDYRK